MENFYNDKSLIEKRIDSFMKQEVYVPTGEHWVVDKLLRCNVFIAPGSKLTVLEISAQNNFIVKDGGELDVRGKSLENSFDGKNPIEVDESINEAEKKFEQVDNTSDSQKKSPEEIIVESRTDADRLKNIFEKVGYSGLDLVMKISKEDLEKAEELVNELDQERITPIDIEYVLRTLKLSPEIIEDLQNTKTIVDVIFSAESNSIDSLRGEGYLTGEMASKMLEDSRCVREKRFNELSKMSAQYKDVSDMLRDYELFTSYLIGEIDDVTPPDAAAENKKYGSLSREHSRQLLDAVKYKIILDNLKSILKK